MLKSLALYTLLAVSAAAPAKADWWCPPGEEKVVRAGGECIFDAPRKQVRAARERWFEAARTEAAGLGVAYEDIVASMFIGWPTKKFCLTVFDHAPSDDLVRRLRQAGLEPLSCSKWHDVNYRSVYRIRKTGADDFLMNYGSYSGPLAAGEWEVVITRNPDGTFTFKDRLIWIS